MINSVAGSLDWVQLSVSSVLSWAPSCIYGQLLSWPVDWLVARQCARKLIRSTHYLLRPKPKSQTMPLLLCSIGQCKLQGKGKQASPLDGRSSKVPLYRAGIQEGWNTVASFLMLLVMKSPWPSPDFCDVS
jgi:hypothetical protein